MPFESDSAPASGGSGRYVFASFEFDIDRGRLARKDDEIFLRPKSSAFLHYLLEHRGQLVSRDELMAAVWPGLVVTNDSVTQCLVEIRKALGDSDHSMVRTVAGRGVIFEAPVKSQDHPQSRWRPRTAWIAAATAAGILLAGAWWFETSHRNAAFNSDPVSVAVLPFIDLSHKDDQEYFADGFSEEIANQLAKLPELKVIARTSSFSFKGSNESIDNIASKLNVATILEGSFWTDGENVRTTAHLLNAYSGVQLWSRVYDHSLEDTFSIPFEIASEVAETLGVKVVGVKQALAGIEPDPNAYRLTLQGQFLYNQRAEGDLAQARDLFRRATEFDPDYALAWARLAAAYRGLYLSGEISYEELIRTGLPAARRALELRPDLAEVQFRAGNYASIAGDFDMAFTYFDQAAQIEPQHHLLQELYIGWRLLTGKQLEAVALSEQLLVKDPLNPLAHLRLVHTTYHAGRFEQMREAAELAWNLNPKILNEIAPYLARAYVLEHRSEKALPLLDKVSAGADRDSLTVLLGDQPELGGSASEAMNRLRSTNTVESAVRTAEIYAWTGDFDQAFLSLDDVLYRFAQAEHWLKGISFIIIARNSRFFSTMHDDPRWADWISELPFQKELGSVQ